MSVALLIMLSIGGLFTGFTAGLFGIGGGTLTIPICILLLPKLGATQNASMHQAIGTSLAIIVFTALAASIKQYQLKNIEFALFKTWIPFVMLGGIAASCVFNFIPASILSLTFMSYLLFYMGYLYFRKPKTNDGTHTTKKIPELSTAIAGFVVGALSIFLGIGGGTFTVPYYLEYGYSLKKSIAISTLTGLFIALYGALSMIYTGYNSPGLARYSLGYINVPTLLIIAPFSMLTASLGVRLNHQLPIKILNNLYIAFLMIILGFMCYNMLEH